MTKLNRALPGIFLFAATATAAAQTAKPPAPAAAPAPTAAAKPAAQMAAPAAKAAAPAAAPAAPAKPAPSKELEAFMKPFEGSWKCDTKFEAGAFGPGSPATTAKSSVKFKKDLDGFAYRGEYEVKKQKGVPMPMKVVLYFGYDPGSSQLVATSVDNMGSIGMGAGKITGDSATYTSDFYMMGMKLKTRETMGAKGPKGATHTFELDMGKGFVAMGQDDCKK